MPTQIESEQSAKAAEETAHGRRVGSNQTSSKFRSRREARPSRIRNFDPLKPPTDKPQSYYDDIKKKFAEERDLRLNYRPEGKAQYITDLEKDADLARYETDPFAEPFVERAPLTDHVECLCIGGGFSALLAAARLREKGVESIRIVERGADVGGTWYWNRYPGIACDTPSYDYIPLLDEMGKVPPNYYAKGPEIYAHCQEIAKKYDLYKLAVFQTTVTSTVWDAKAEALARRHRPRRQDDGQLRDRRQRHAVAAEAVATSTA